MDGNFSILDSWSLENDVPSDKSISYNGRDYTHEFTTEQAAKCQNTFLVVRGGKYKPPRYLAEGQSFSKNTGTKKCDCPFELRGKPIPPDGVKWGLRVACGFHNHALAEHFEGHEYTSRQKPIEKQFVVNMANSTAPREILSILKQRDSSNSTGIRSVYNAISKNKEAKRGGLTCIQYVLDQLISKGYRYDYITNPVTNEITDIVWVHPRSIELSVNFSSVFIIDATYKTNEYRMPLVEVVGITSTMLTYSLMYAYINNHGFRAIAAHLGYSHENGWAQVRLELMEEIQQNKYLYDVVYPMNDCANLLLYQLNYLISPAPSEYWMDTMTLGVVIASRYNLVLHTFEENVGGYFTHLPLTSPPGQEHREIAIARVRQHIVQVFLHPHYPVPPIPRWWHNNSSREAKRWAVHYTHCLALWFEVMGIATNEDGP